MTKADLKDGMVVEIRCGRRYLVLRGHLLNEDGGFMFLDSFDKNMEAMIGERSDERDIVKVYYPTLIHALDVLNKRTDGGLIWKREEIKEVTMAEIEEKFGCKVKVVKE